jgi:hypothetical protein
MDDDDDQHIDPRLWDSVYTPPPPPTNHPAGNNPPVTAAPIAAAPVAAASVADTSADLAGTPPPPSPSVTQAAPRGKPAKKSSGDRWTAVEIQALREGNADANWKYRRMIVSSTLFSCRGVPLAAREPLAPGGMVACPHPADPVYV